MNKDNKRLAVLSEVPLNWVDSTISRTLPIPEFFEWDQEADGIDRFEKMPIVYVYPDLFDFIYYNCQDLPEGLLDEVRNRSIRARSVITYAFVVTDGDRFLAVDTGDENEKKPHFKSTLVSRQEEDARWRVADKEPHNYGWEPNQQLAEEIDELYEEEEEDSLTNKLLNLPPESFVGLTRTERELKQLLMECLFTLSCSDNIQAVRYWTEGLIVKYQNTDDLDEADIDELVELMYEHVKIGWSPAIEEFGSSFVKWFECSSQAWEDLINSKVVREKELGGKK